MPKRASLYGVAMLSVAMFMTAGCATYDVVKKDESSMPPPAARQAEPPKSGVTPAGQTVSAAVPQVPPANRSAARPDQQGLSTSQLQSALEKIYFDYDSAELTEPARKTLARNAALLMKEPTARVRIEGNCDERGSAEYNVALGEKRARSALQYLKALGIKPDRLYTLSYGKDKPAVEGHDEAAMAKNRRDEFVVLTR